MTRQVNDILDDIKAFEPQGGSWLRLDELLAELWSVGVDDNALSILFGVFERFPNDDGAGVFWSIVHGIEALDCDYESPLRESLKRRSSTMGKVMLERLERGMPEGREPLPLRWIRAHGVSELTPWCLIDDDDERASLRREYCMEVSSGSIAVRDVVPFARRHDCDDMAGFIVDGGRVTGEVLLVHLTWSYRPEQPGLPISTRLDDFWSWLKLAIDDTADWCSEQELADLLDSDEQSSD